MNEPTYLNLADLADGEVVLLDDAGEPVVVIFVGASYLSVDVRRPATARVFRRVNGVVNKTDIALPDAEDPTFNYAVEDWHAAPEVHEEAKVVAALRDAKEQRAKELAPYFDRLKVAKGEGQ